MYKIDDSSSVDDELVLSDADDDGEVEKRWTDNILFCYSFSFRLSLLLLSLKTCLQRISEYMQSRE